MHRAYVFREGIEAKPENRKLAERVTVDEYAWKKGDRVKCTFEPCFQSLGPVIYKDPDYSNHWRHLHPPPGGYCRYYDEKGSKKKIWRPRSAALADVHSAIGVSVAALRAERLLSRQLTSRHAVNSLRATLVDDLLDEHEFAYIEGEPAIKVGERGAVYSFSRGNAKVRSQSEQLGNRTAIPIVAVHELERLNGSSLRQHLQEIVERQPVPVIRPRASGQSGPWGLLTSPDETDPGKLETLDRSAVPIIFDARALFGEPKPEAEWPWPPEGALPIWILSEYLTALDAVRGGIGRSDPLNLKMLRLIAKRFLVEGGQVHRSLFEQEREEALDFFRIARKTFPRAKDILSREELRGSARTMVLFDNDGVADGDGAERPAGLGCSKRVQEAVRDLQAAGESYFEKEQERNQQIVENVEDLKEKAKLLEAEEARLEKRVDSDRKKVVGEIAASETKLEGKLKTASAEFRKTLDEHLAKGIDATKEGLEEKIETQGEKLERQLNESVEQLGEKLEADHKKLKGDLGKEAVALKAKIQAERRARKSELKKELTQEHDDRTKEEDALKGAIRKVRTKEQQLEEKLEELNDNLEDVRRSEGRLGTTVTSLIGVLALILVVFLLTRWCGGPEEVTEAADSAAEVADVGSSSSQTPDWPVGEGPGDPESRTGPRQPEPEVSQGPGPRRDPSPPPVRNSRDTFGPITVPETISSKSPPAGPDPSVSSGAPSDETATGQDPGSESQNQLERGPPGSSDMPGAPATEPGDSSSQGSAPSSGKPVATPTAVRRATLSLDVETHRRKGRLTVWLGETRILDEKFDYGKKQLPKSISRSHEFDTGTLDLRVVFAPKRGPSQTKKLSAEIPGNATLRVRISKKGTLVAIVVPR